MAAMGYRTFNEMIGQMQMLDKTEAGARIERVTGEGSVDLAVQERLFLARVHDQRVLGLVLERVDRPGRGTGVARALGERRIFGFQVAIHFIGGNVMETERRLSRRVQSVDARR